MSLTKMFRLYAVKCGSTVFDSLQDATLSTNVQHLVSRPPGGSLALFTANMQERPDVSFGTAQVESALNLFGVAGGDAGATVLLGQKMVNLTGPVAVASTVHTSYTAAAALGYINSISAGNRREAAAQCMLKFLRSGATAALTYSGSAALDSVALAGTEKFVLGPIVVAGAVLEGTNDFSINFNPAVIEPDDEYQVEPVFAAVEAAPPTITFTTTDPSIWSLHNTAVTNLKVNLVKLKNKVQREADAATEHILMVAGAARLTCESVGGTKQLTRVRVDPISADNSTAEVVVTLNSAVATS